MILDREQGARMPLGEMLPGEELLHIGGQLQQAQRVGDGRAALAHTLPNFGLGEGKSLD